MECLDLLGGDDLKYTLEMTPKEDKNLDGATVGQVREIFKIWIRSDEAKAEANNDRYYKLRNPRYMFYVHVDTDVLDAVLVRAPELPLHEALGTAYVNLVQHRAEFDPKYVEFDDEEPFDKYEKTDMDIAKVGISVLGADSYSNLNHDRFDRLERHIDDNDMAL